MRAGIGYALRTMQAGCPSNRPVRSRCALRSLGFQNFSKGRPALAIGALWITALGCWLALPLQEFAKSKPDLVCLRCTLLGEIVGA